MLPNANIPITNSILLRVAEIAESRGVEIYVVGGFVRDSLLNGERTDIDITVVGDALEFARIVAAEVGSHPVEYERFRTAMVPIDHFKVEFVGTRKEEYSAGSRNPVVTEGTLTDDLRRRDFTVNAMAASLQPYNLGEIIDLFEGQIDLERGLLRTPLNPGITMQDDPLRMMRAARFASQLNFEIHPETLQAITEMSHQVGIISQERITDEFLKIMATKKPSVGLYVLRDTGLLEHVFPEVHQLAGVDLVQMGSREFAHKDVFKHTLQVVDNVAEMSDNLWLRFATLMHDIAKPRTKKFVEGHGWTFHGHEEVGARWQQKIFRRLKLPFEHLPYVETLVRLHQRPMKLVDEGVTDAAIRRLAVLAGDWIDDLFTLCRADVTTRNPKRAERYLENYAVVQQKILDVRERDQLRAFQSPVRGEEIMQITGLPPSRKIGYLKWMIEEAILDGIIENNRDQALEYLNLNLATWMNEAENVNFGRRG